MILFVFVYWVVFVVCGSINLCFVIQIKQLIRPGHLVILAAPIGGCCPDYLMVVLGYRDTNLVVPSG